MFLYNSLWHIWLVKDKVFGFRSASPWPRKLERDPLSCQYGYREATGTDGSSVLKPLHPGPQGEWPQSSHERLEAVRGEVAPLRPLSWTGDPKDRQAGLGPKLRHGTVLSPQLSGPHSPAWSQGPSRVPSGLSRSWLIGDPQRGLGKEKERPALNSASSDFAQAGVCTVGCLVVAREQ